MYSFIGRIIIYFAEKGALSKTYIHPFYFDTYLKVVKGKGPNVFTRPRRDSSSSLSTASEAKGSELNKSRKDEPTKKERKEAVKKEAKDLKEQKEWQS